MTKKICTVRGLDYQGLPLVVIVEAASVYEAGARAMDEIRKVGGRPSELQITMHEPKKQWKIHPVQLFKWVQFIGAKDNVGLKDVKRHVYDWLEPFLKR
jgi:hypothetical protein